jgi:hypothetical protein
MTKVFESSVLEAPAPELEREWRATPRSRSNAYFAV